MSGSRNPKSTRPRLEEIEPRVLLSAGIETAFVSGALAPELTLGADESLAPFLAPANEASNADVAASTNTSS